MELNMMEIGKIIKHKEKENSYILTEIFMMENGHKIKQKDMGFISTKMEVNMSVIGKITNNMVKVLNLGKQDHNMKASFLKVENMEKANMFGEMVLLLQAIGNII